MGGSLEAEVGSVVLTLRREDPASRRSVMPTLMVDDEFLGVQKGPKQVAEGAGGRVGIVESSASFCQFGITWWTRKRAQERLLPGGVDLRIFSSIRRAVA